MKNLTILSKHADIRLKQRTELTPSHITKIIGSVKYVDLGSLPGFNNKYLLFYSVLDNEYFVAVQNGSTGNIITILPTRLQDDLPRKITEVDFDTAKIKILESTSNRKNEPSKFHIKYHYTESGIERSRKLCSLDCIEYTYDINRFIKKVDIFSLVEKELKLQNILRTVHSISIRRGNDGIPVILDYIK